MRLLLPGLWRIRTLLTIGCGSIYSIICWCCWRRKGSFRVVLYGRRSVRVLFDLPRFSEGLDFTFVDSQEFDFRDVLKRIKGKLPLAGYSVEVSFRRVGSVVSGWVKFDGLLREAGLSPPQGERLAVKIEVRQSLSGRIVDKVHHL